MIIYPRIKRRFFMKKAVSLILVICLIFLIIGILPVHGESEIYDSVLRLHVLANSDSDADQALKLCVRDKIIELSNSLYMDCESLEEVREVAAANLDNFRECARAEILQRGYDYDVSVKLGVEEYPRKSYTSLCFPSGEYLSLQVIIGEGAGQNWWCVLFPPLCLDAASKPTTNEDAFISVGLTSEQYKIITETKNPTYEARFKLLELISQTVNS